MSEQFSREDMERLIGDAIDESGVDPAKLRAAADFIEQAKNDPDSPTGLLIRAVGDRLCYDDLIKKIRRVPDTWVPALMLECVRQGYRNPVFTPNGASTMVRELEVREDYDTQEGVNAARKGEADDGTSQSREVPDVR